MSNISLIPGKLIMKENSTVFLVDDEDTFREGLSQLLQISGMKVESFSTAEDFLKNFDPAKPGCLVLDLNMPGINGLELQETLAKKEIKIPIIFITGHGDIPKTVQALKAGAVDFLEKPFRKQVLLKLVKGAIDLDIKNRKNEKNRIEIQQRYRELTNRLKEVMELLVYGNSNKEIASKLNLSHRTVEIHRKKIMEKMKADSLAELVSMASICGLKTPHS